jgi:hypothetical protein
MGVKVLKSRKTEVKICIGVRRGVFKGMGDGCRMPALQAGHHRGGPHARYRRVRHVGP